MTELGQQARSLGSAEHVLSVRSQLRFWTISHVFLRPMPTITRRVAYASNLSAHGCWMLIGAFNVLLRPIYACLSRLQVNYRGKQVWTRTCMPFCLSAARLFPCQRVAACHICAHPRSVLFPVSVSVPVSVTVAVAVAVAVAVVVAVAVRPTTWSLRTPTAFSWSARTSSPSTVPPPSRPSSASSPGSLSPKDGPSGSRRSLRPVPPPPLYPKLGLFFFGPSITDFEAISQRAVPPTHAACRAPRRGRVYRMLMGAYGRMSRPIHVFRPPPPRRPPPR